MEDGETVGLMCLTCPKKACDGCPKVAKTPEVGKEVELAAHQEIRAQNYVKNQERTY